MCNEIISKLFGWISYKFCPKLYLSLVIIDFFFCYYVPYLILEIIDDITGLDLMINFPIPFPENHEYYLLHPLYTFFKELLLASKEIIFHYIYLPMWLCCFMTLL